MTLHCNKCREIVTLCKNKSHFRLGRKHVHCPNCGLLRHYPIQQYNIVKVIKKMSSPEGQTKQKVWRIIDPLSLIGFKVVGVISKTTDKKSMVVLTFYGWNSNYGLQSKGSVERTIQVGLAGDLWEEVEV